MKAIILSVILLTACETIPNPSVQVVDNPQKDTYIERLEVEAQESAAALLVAKDNVTGKGLPLIELTQQRMAGIRQPIPPLITKYTKMIDDEKAFKAEQERVDKVDAETSMLYDMVEAKDRENAELKASLAAQAKEHAWDELRSKFLTLSGIFAMVGAGIIVISTFTGGKGKGAGVCMILLSVFFGGAPFVIREFIESVYCLPILLTLAGLGAAWAAWSLRCSHKELKSRLTQPEGQQ
jgi:hypothetical protein